VMSWVDTPTCDFTSGVDMDLNGLPLDNSSGWTHPLVMSQVGVEWASHLLQSSADVM